MEAMKNRHGWGMESAGWLLTAPSSASNPFPFSIFFQSITLSLQSAVIQSSSSPSIFHSSIYRLSAIFNISTLHEIPWLCLIMKPVVRWANWFPPLVTFHTFICKFDWKKRSGAMKIFWVRLTTKILKITASRPAVSSQQDNFYV